MSTQRYVSGLAVTARLYCGGMALLYRATLRPSKLELLASYLGTGDLSALGSYRFDDPTGEVGIETHLVKSGADVLHIPLTYRSEPLGGAEEWGIGTLDHSVLGKRWVYSGCADPVYATELIRAILTGGTQVEQYFEEGEERLYREPTATVLGSGAADTPVPKISGVHAESFDADTLIDAGGVQVVVRHGLSTPEPDSASGTLSGIWSGTVTPVVLAYLP
jgi:hypothetical protein